MDYENNWFLLKEFLEAAIVSMVQKMTDGEVLKINEDEFFAQTSDSLCMASGLYGELWTYCRRTRLTTLRTYITELTLFVTMIHLWST